jgi:hypothetical protein
MRIQKPKCFGKDSKLCLYWELNKKKTLGSLFGL